MIACMARAATTSDVFNAIAEPQRRDILVLLRAGEIPVTITIVDLPPALAEQTGAPQVRMKVNHHFRVTPGGALSDALSKANANVKYVFDAPPVPSAPVRERRNGFG